MHHCTVCQGSPRNICLNKGHLVECKDDRNHTYPPSRNSFGCPYCIDAEAKKLKREAKEASKPRLNSVERRKEEARLAKEAEHAKLTRGKKKEKKSSPEEAAKPLGRS